MYDDLVELYVPGARTAIICFECALDVMTDGSDDGDYCADCHSYFRPEREEC